MHKYITDMSAATREVLLKVSNEISRRIGRKMAQDELARLNFIINSATDVRHLSAPQYIEAIITKYNASASRTSPHIVETAEARSALARHQQDGVRETNELMLDSDRRHFTTFDNITLVHNVIQFDSRNRSINHNYSGEYKWGINYTGNTAPGSANVRDFIQNIAQVRIEPFWIPVTDDTYYKKVRMSIREFGAQSVDVPQQQGTIQTRYTYTFDFDVIDQYNGMMLIKSQQDVFTFQVPIPRLDSITVAFYTPFNQMTFPADRDTATITATTATTATLTTLNAHNLNTGDVVFFNAGNTIPILNALDGFYVTRLSVYTFEINAAVSGFVGTSMDVFYGNRRITFQMEFVSLD